MCKYLKLRNFVEDNIGKFNWYSLSSLNINSIHFLEHAHYDGNPNKIDWSALSQNKNANHILENAHYGGNPDKIKWK